jgi:hypothetical protein
VLAIVWRKPPTKTVTSSSRYDMHVSVRHFLPSAGSVRQGDGNPLVLLKCFLQISSQYLGSGEKLRSFLPRDLQNRGMPAVPSSGLVALCLNLSSL